MRFSAWIKPLIVIFLFTCLFSFFPNVSFAQEKTVPISSNSAKQTGALVSNTNSDVPDNLHNWTQTVMIEVFSAFTCQISGVDPINPKQPCLGADIKTGKIGFLPSQGGAIGFMSNMIALLYAPPLHTGDYFQYLGSNFGINKRVYAQQTGTGFDSLRPLMGIWSASRNIVYLFLVIVFVIIGLAIMLRIKIDPRTVMTIQNQIPKIIIGILAITFSFAIAGFLVDMMWVLIFLIYNVITQAAGFEVIKADGILHGGTPFGVLGAGNGISILWEFSKGIGDIIMNMVGFKALTNFTNDHWWLIFIPIANQALGIMQGLQAILGFVGGAIAFLVISIAFLIAMFRLWFTLIKAYVTILLDVVLAPFWIIGGILPGSSISFGGWIRDMAANLLAFPATITMFMFAVLFKNIFTKFAGGGQPYFFPPLIGDASNMGPDIIGTFISLGIILMTPNVVTMLKTMLKSIKFETGLGRAVGAGNPMTAFNKAGQIGLSYSGLKSLPFIGKRLGGK
jgi:hypothetical protein